MLRRSDHSLALIVGRLAMAVALVILIVFPLGYFVLGYQSAADHAEIQSDFKAGVITGLISSSPDLWTFQVQRLEELLVRYPAPLKEESARVLDANGAVVVSVGARPPAPLLRRSSAVYESGRIVGRVEIEHSYRQTLYGTAAVALLCLLLAGATYVTLRILPLRALRQVTAELFREKEKWQFALEGGGDGVWDWNLASGETLYSQTYLDMFGYSAEELRRPENTFDKRIHPADWPTVKAELDAYIAGKSPVYVVDRRMRCRDGSWKWVRGRGMAVSRDEAGRPLRIIGTYTDISEQKYLTQKLQESDKLLQDVSAQVPGIIFQLRLSPDGHFRFPFISKARVDLYGAALPQVHEDASSLFDYVHPDDLDSFMASIHESGRTLQLWQRDYRVAVPELGVRWRSGHARPARLEDGSILWHGFITDITDRVAAEAERSLLEEQLSNAQRIEAIGTLAAGIAHDFNNIIGTISGNTALARQDVGSGHKALESLDEIHKASQRARHLVQQILTFSRKQPQHLVSQPLRPLVEEAVRLLRSTLPAGVDFVATIADAPAHVLADSTQVQQLILNLCTNAWHALHERSGRIEVGLDEVMLDEAAARALPGLKPGPHLRLRVSDNGRGMDAATQKRIFEPFFTTKPVGQGTGLGLAAVHGIVNVHKGAIAMKSAPGRGATFLVYFPVAADFDGPDEAVPAVFDILRGKGQHVLYVDDDESLVFLVMRMLNRLGYRTSGFQDARLALDAVRANPGSFDLAVTDFNMPGLSGLDVAMELARVRPDLPVVITSGYITDALRVDANKAGVRALVDKPSTVDELCQVIQQVLNAPAHQSG
ncbi:MAG: PAS domain-containing protein [Proteobacteria bacterium]|nr:PAS domain-containing protein [Pseudomonadota bacterium]